MCLCVLQGAHAGRVPVGMFKRPMCGGEAVGGEGKDIVADGDTPPVGAYAVGGLQGIGAVGLLLHQP